MRRRSYARLRRWGHIFGASFSLFHTHTLLPLLFKVFFLITLEAVEHKDPYAFDSFVYTSRMHFKCRAYNDIYDTSYLRAVLSLSPNAASRPSSHFARTSGRATPASRPQELGRCPSSSSGHDELLSSTTGAGAPTLAHTARRVRPKARRQPSASRGAD